MKKFLMILGYIILGFVLTAYCAFLFVLPRIFDLNKYKPEVQKLAKEYAQLDVNFENVKISTTPALTVGLTTEDISVKLPDGSDIFTADKFTTRVSLPHLLLLTVRVSALDFDNPFINAEIINDENFKISKHLEPILTKQNQEKIEEVKNDKEEQIEEATNSDLPIDISKIKIIVPNAKLNNYRVLINDLKSKHYLELKGQQLSLGYFNGEVGRAKTKAEFYSDEDKNITANVDIKSFLPKFEPSLDEEDDPDQKVELPFINPVTMYRNYDLKANLDTKLNIKNSKKDMITSNGYFNIDGFTMKLSDIQLPESYLHLKTSGTKVNLDTNLNLKDSEKLSVLGSVNYGKSAKLDMNISSTPIYFNDLLVLARAFMDSIHVRHDLAGVSANGFFRGDCNIKSDFKTLTSNGYLTVMNGALSVKGVGNVISKAKILLLLDNNVLNIHHSSLYVANSRVDVNGKIDENSYTDVSIKADKISIPVLYKAFAPKSLSNAYSLNSADLGIDFNIKGQIENAQSTLFATLSNFNLSDGAKTFVVKNEKLTASALLVNNDLSAKVLNKNFGINLTPTNSKVLVPNFDMGLVDNNIEVNENSIYINDASSLKYSGKIVDYTKLKSLDFITEGNLDTNDIIKLIGKEYSSYFHSKGALPVKVTFDGNAKKQKLYAHLLGKPDAYFTPVDMADLIGKNTALKTTVVFKPNRIKIKETGLYELGSEASTEIVGVNGTIVGDKINLLRITLPKALQGKIYAFPKSEFTVGGNVILYNKLSSPLYKGSLTIANLSIPELFLTMKTMNVELKSHFAKFVMNNLLLNGSDFRAGGIVDLEPSSVINVKNLRIFSRELNVDTLMKVVDELMKYMPEPSTNVASEPADIPVKLHNGRINFKHIKTGNINVTNAIGKISLNKNIFYLRDMRANVFDGTVDGRVEVDLITSLIKVMVGGQDIDVDKMLVDAAGMKDMLSGKADFTTDISLSGATYEEQMKSLKGSIDFSVTDGQFGPFGKLENMIIAENIRESEFFQTVLGGVINNLTTIDTTHFTLLTGHLTFDDGVCHIEPITSLGTILSLHLFGDFDLLNNTMDMKVRARLSSLTSKLLGPLNAINPVNLATNAAGMNVFAAKAFSIFCEVVPEEEMEILPSFASSYVDRTATKFQLVLKGDLDHPFRLVKSFKWLATQVQVDSATEFVNSLPDPLEEGSSIENEVVKQTVSEMDTRHTIIEKIKNFFNKWRTPKEEKIEFETVVE